MQRASLPLLALSGLLLGAAVPCLWDRDTLEQERARFPTALALIAGKFPRHTEAYYRWRIEDRQAKLELGDTSPGVFDDLAVAHSKLHDDARAIELMAEKEERHPGLYETAANLGTFHVHAGNLEEGVKHIQRAIEINPDAHFGREIYQELLARYVLEVRGDSERLRLPMDRESAPNFHRRSRGYWSFVEKVRKVTDENRADEIAKAMSGVLGMLRFGNHDSPVLLEALSDVLLADSGTDGKRLAARALLKASYEVEDEEVRGAYRAKAEAALETQTPAPDKDQNISLEQVEQTFATELDDARRWYAKLEAKEQYWIDAGEDVDARFGQTYYAKPTPPVNEDGAERYRMVKRYGWIVAGLSIVIAAGYLATLARRS